jgi:hypothetical protein
MAEYCLVQVQLRVGPLQFGIPRNVRLEEQHFFIKFCFKLGGKNATGTFKI